MKFTLDFSNFNLPAGYDLTEEKLKAWVSAGLAQDLNSFLLVERLTSAANLILKKEPKNEVRSTDSFCKQLGKLLDRGR